MNFEEFWELLPLIVYMWLVGIDIFDNEALLYVVLLTGVKAAFSMLLKKSLDWIVDDNVCVEAVDRLLAGVTWDTMDIFTLSCLIGKLGQHDKTEPIIMLLNYNVYKFRGVLMLNNVEVTDLGIYILYE